MVIKHIKKNAYTHLSTTEQKSDTCNGVNIQLAQVQNNKSPYMLQTQKYSLQKQIKWDISTRKISQKCEKFL